jgi:hypothetical protein
MASNVEIKGIMSHWQKNLQDNSRDMSRIYILTIAIFDSFAYLADGVPIIAL